MKKETETSMILAGLTEDQTIETIVTVLDELNNRLSTKNLKNFVSFLADTITANALKQQFIRASNDEDRLMALKEAKSFYEQRLV
jgi:hypothetical protein